MHPLWIPRAAVGPKGMKNVVDGVPVSLTVCVVSPSSRSKPDAGVTSFRETVITLLLQIRCKVHYFFTYAILYYLKHIFV